MKTMLKSAALGAALVAAPMSAYTDGHETLNYVISISTLLTSKVFLK